MEKFYIVKNEKFLGEIQKYLENSQIRSSLINRFYEDKGIDGKDYHISGDGFVNIPFNEKNKGDIRLYIEDSVQNDEKFGKQLRKPKTFSDGSRMRCFKKNSPILKEFPPSTASA